MARTGARGSTLNLGQMTAALGQQSVRGKRIEKGYLNRALPHFSRMILALTQRDLLDQITETD